MKGHIGSIVSSTIFVLVAFSTSAETVELDGMTITKKDARRQDVKDAISVGAPRKPKITSEDRINPPSKAHDRGAVDIRSKDVSAEQRHKEAKDISKALGSRGTVIVEEPHRPARGAAGPSVQFNSAYKDGRAGNVRTGPAIANEVHTHVQPDLPTLRDREAALHRRADQILSSTQDEDTRHRELEKLTAELARLHQEQKARSGKSQ